MQIRLRAIFIIFLLFPICTAAQKSQGIRGKVTDVESGKPMAYVTVSAVDSKNKQTGIAISQPSGEFFLHLPKPDRYTLYFSYVGYGTASQKVEFTGETISLNSIALKPGVEIEEVIVAAKPLIRQQSDRIVFDVGKDPEIGKYKMMGIMSKIPDLEMSPQNGNLRYNGQAVLTILIDGRKEELINGSRQYPMEFIRADYMAQIELILPESPEYNNNGPIINIKLSRPLPYGIAGEIRPEASTDRRIGTGADLILNTPISSIGLNYKFGFSDAPKLETRTERENFLPESQSRRLESHSESGSMSRSHDIEISLSRPLFRETGKIRLKANTSLNESAGIARSSSEGSDESGNQTASNTSLSRSNSLSPMRINIGAGFNKLWKKKITTLKVDFGYNYTDNRTDNGLLNINTTLSGSPREWKSNASNGSVQHAVRGTFSYYSKAGIRSSSHKMLLFTSGYVNRVYKNTSQYYDYDYAAGEYLENETRFNGLNYRQQMTYFYLSYLDKLFNNKLSYSVKLQGEYLSNKGVYLGVRNSPLDYHEFNVIPNLSISYKYKKCNFNFNYAGAVQRPNMTQLNPYVNDSDPENIRYGNPKLRGQYRHNISCSINKRFNRFFIYNISLNYKFSRTNKAIETVTTVDKENIAFTTYENIGRSSDNNIFLNLSTHSFLRKTMRASFRLNYIDRHYRFHNGQENRTRQFSGSLSLNLYVIKTLDLDVNYNYAPAYTSAQTRSNSYYGTMDLSLSKYFPKAHLGGSIRVSDLLNGHKFVRNTIGSETFLQNSYRERLGRVFRVSIYWRFGKFKQTENPQNIDAGVYDMGGE